MMQRTITANNTPHAKPKLSQILLGLRDIKTWLGALVIGALALNIAAFSSFLPTFIHEFGFSPLRTQLMSMIPYWVATITLPGLSILSDKLQKRAVIVLLCFISTLAGFIIVMLSWPGHRHQLADAEPRRVFSKRSTAWAVSQVFIQSWSIVSSQIYTSPPRFFKGHGVLLGLNALGLVAGIVNYYIMKRKNAAKDRKALEYEQGGQEDPDHDKSYEELCDEHPKFRYAL